MTTTLRVGEAATRINWPTSAVTVANIEYWDITTERVVGDQPFRQLRTVSADPIPTTAAASRMQRVTVRAAAPGDTQARITPSGRRRNPIPR